MTTESEEVVIEIKLAGDQVVSAVRTAASGSGTIAVLAGQLRQRDSSIEAT